MTNLEKPDMLLWVDVETTGLDPDHDRILEVELRCTDMRCMNEVGRFHRIIGIGGRRIVFNDSNLAAWRAHSLNGLLEDAIESECTEEETANALEEYADSLAQAFTLHPAGTNPQFDLEFIGRLCPSLPLHYRRIDMAAIRETLDVCGWDPPSAGETRAESAHRTSTCLDRDIKEYRQIIHDLSMYPVRTIPTKGHNQ